MGQCGVLSSFGHIKGERRPTGRTSRPIPSAGIIPSFRVDLLIAAAMIVMMRYALLVAKLWCGLMLVEMIARGSSLKHEGSRQEVARSSPKAQKSAERSGQDDRRQTAISGLDGG